jgi:hypothetical protein
MKYRITERHEAGTKSYSAIGDLGMLIDAAYNAGALGVTAIRVLA